MAGQAGFVVGTTPEQQFLNFGIQKIEDLVRVTDSTSGTATADDDLLRKQVKAAEAGQWQIGFVTDATSDDSVRRNSATHRVQGEDAFASPRMIMSAISAVCILAAFSSKENHKQFIKQKLGNLLALCESNITSPFRRRSYGHGLSYGLMQNNLSVENSLTRLLQPENITWISREMGLCTNLTIQLACGRSQNEMSTSCLEFHQTSWLFEDGPQRPAGLSPLLVSHNADIILAASSGNVSKLFELIDAQPSYAYSCTLTGLTPMFFAIRSGNLAAVKCLISKGVSVNHYFGHQKTSPLAAALQFRHLHLVKFFLKQKASLHHRNSYGWSPLFFLWFQQKINSSAAEFIRLLASQDDFPVMHKGILSARGWGVMHRAAVFGDACDIDVLIDCGVKAYEPEQMHGPFSDYGSRPGSALWTVVHYGRYDSFLKLLPIYKDLFNEADFADSNGWTLLHVAVDRGFLNIAGELIRCGADTEARTEPISSGNPHDTEAYRYTPMMLAQESGSSLAEEFTRILELNSHREPWIHHGSLPERAMAQLNRGIRSDTSETYISDSLETSLSPSRAGNCGSIVKGRSDRPRKYQDLVRRTELVSPGSSNSKTYGNTAINGKCRAQLGDIYITKNYFRTITQVIRPQAYRGTTPYRTIKKRKKKRAK